MIKDQGIYLCEPQSGLHPGKFWVADVPFGNTIMFYDRNCQATRAVDISNTIPVASDPSRFEMYAVMVGTLDCRVSSEGPNGGWSGCVTQFVTMGGAVACYDQ
jgi:hypothetical protein